jgi:carbon storage regulator
MLVLTRKLMEKLFIGDDICVTVVRLEGGQVRLGIEAPREVSVVRAELVPKPLATWAEAGPRRRTDHARSPSPANPEARTSPRHRLR